MAVFTNKQKSDKSEKITASELKPLTDQQIQETQNLAYQFFEDRGYEHGHDQEDWLKAETIVRSK